MQFYLNNNEFLWVMTGGIFRYGIDHLTPNTAIKIARGEIEGILTEETIKSVNKCHETVIKIAKGHKPVYAINTGFGSLKNKNIKNQ